MRNPFWIYPLQFLEIKPEVKKFAENDPTRGITTHFMNLNIEMTFLELTPRNYQLSKFDKRRDLPYKYAQYIVFKSNRLVRQSYGIVISLTILIFYLSSETSCAAQEIHCLIVVLMKNGFDRKRLMESVI